ncbi:Hypothetical predicted protein [Podarcis lilfordi]|uniref:Uncharacterized protein n=1 Tax=Podarcis lilfordi TaxID=74358 RepID=A0AA35L487_9SAUR|nr:Hypothetical predicted protein [Podarcis lilfordi]
MTSREPASVARMRRLLTLPLAGEFESSCAGAKRSWSWILNDFYGLRSNTTWQNVKLFYRLLLMVPTKSSCILSNFTKMQQIHLI